MSTVHRKSFGPVTIFFLAIVCAQIGASAAAQEQIPPRITDADYARAEKVLDYHLARSVRNLYVSPHWIGNQGAFWYRRETVQGGEFMLVDPAAKRVAAAFDHQRLANALAQFASSSVVDAADLPVSSIERDGSGLKLELSKGKDFAVSCTTTNYACTAKPVIREARRDVIEAPDGATSVFVRHENFWILDSNTGQERQLTNDGEAYFSYGKLPDSSTVTVPVLRKQITLPPFGVEWSPDGRMLIGTRSDDRAVGVFPFVEWLPQDGSHRPISYNLRIPLLGDKNEPRPEGFVIDVSSGRKVAMTLPEGWHFDGVLGWSPDGLKAFLLISSFGQKTLSLVEVDARSGARRTIVEETGPTNVGSNNVPDSNSNISVLAASGEAIWFSERDGWGHLYLYDIRSGRLKNRITTGEWLVRDVVHVDSRRRQIYFTATGREAGEDLYYRHLYRASLNGGNPTLLTPENAEHEVEPPLSEDVGTFPGQAKRGSPFSPDGRYFVDTYSTVDTPPVNVLRSAATGAIVMKLEQADATATYAAGWHAPQRFRAKAADGRTDLFGVIYLPPGYQAARKYPIVDAFYGGPQELNAPRSFNEAVATSNPTSRSSLAQLGFIVVTLDARGTPGRSKAFHDVGYGNFADPEIDDHIAVIKQLARRYPGIDLDRVGVYGHSFGGYNSARAILSHPEFFKVAVSSAGAHNYQAFYTGFEAAFGIPDYGGGSRFRPTPQAVPESYLRLDNGPLAANLRGHLMLVHGDMDENAYMAQTLHLVDALIKANKSFDLVYLPNRDHSILRFDAYFTRRMWDYFVLHLLGAQPPENYNLQPLERGICSDEVNILAAGHDMCHF